MRWRRVNCLRSRWGAADGGADSQRNHWPRHGNAGRYLDRASLLGFAMGVAHEGRGIALSTSFAGRCSFFLFAWSFPPLLSPQFPLAAVSLVCGRQGMRTAWMCGVAACAAAVDLRSAIPHRGLSRGFAFIAPYKQQWTFSPCICLSPYKDACQVQPIASGHSCCDCAGSAEAGSMSVYWPVDRVAARDMRFSASSPVVLANAFPDGGHGGFSTADVRSVVRA
ncbi:hypothetical protein C8R47DRAFT_1164542 [Mycena vitilis]|nr:hypothetical protein C8R47DRAFT_1164542 [Mycena vitilis]